MRVWHVTSGPISDHWVALGSDPDATQTAREGASPPGSSPTKALRHYFPAGDWTSPHGTTSPTSAFAASGGSKVWTIFYRLAATKQQRRESLGDIRMVTLEDARKIAHQRFAQIRLGVDPKAERDKARAEAAVTKFTFAAAVTDYLDAKGRSCARRATRQRSGISRCIGHVFATVRSPTSSAPTSRCSYER